MTFSLTARCAKSGMLGVAVTSSSVCVGSRCVFARADTGAVASQNLTDPRLGRLGLDLLASGFSAPQVLGLLIDKRPDIEFRQLAIVDRDGRTASYSGERTLGQYAVAEDKGCVAAGNLLASEAVPREMVSAFRGCDQTEHLAQRLIKALEAGLAAGGEEDTVHSAAVYVVERQSWPVVDLRVDWHETTPIAELRGLWDRYAPQIEPYVSRAIFPSLAPSFGVKGDI
ncbi:MAG: DUF1028 domain-containing protein [Vulcanimicrobiaceae bacterium]